MKKYVSFLVAMIATGLAAVAQQTQQVVVIPASTGIWIDFSRIHHAKLSFAITRKTKAGENRDIATVPSPSHYEEFKAAYYESFRKQAFGESLGDSSLKAVWRQYQKNAVIDEMGMFASDLHILYALGAAWYDETAGKNQFYEYGVKSSGTDPYLYSKSVEYPSSDKNIGSLKPLAIRNSLQAVYVEFEVTNNNTMRTCNVYRSYYLRTQPVKIRPMIAYFTRNGKTIVGITDNTATPKVLYSYYVVPVDAAGNEGSPSTPINLYDVQANSIPPSVRHLSATSVASKSAIQLVWMRPASPDVISVQLYRGDKWAGIYRKIASLRPQDTVYMDYDVEPVKTYFYTISINGIYEQSVNSARVPGILKGSKRNYLPPQNFRATVKGRVVTLTWMRTEKDTRGYYIYRGPGYHGDLKKLHPLLASTDSAISYTDTLPDSRTPEVYSYALTDENTSYAESPKTERASVQYIPVTNSFLPIVTKITIVPSDNAKLQVMWTNLKQHDPMVTGYLLSRTSKGANGKIIKSGELLSPKPLKVNYYEDADIAEGNTYIYSVKAVLSNDAEGSPSGESGYKVPMILPLQVSNVQCFASNGNVQLQWQNPQGGQLKKLYILRAITGKKPELLSTLEPSQEKYTDKEVKKGSIYNYYIITENMKEHDSEPTTAVSVRVN